MTNIIYEKNINKLVKTASCEFKKAVLSVLRKKDKVVVAFPGGRSVSLFLEELSNLDILWKNIYIFMIDERLNMRPDQKGSNFKVVNDFLLKNISIPKSNIFPFLGDVKEYTKDVLVLSGIDIVVLGAGEDSHVAGLFPNLSVKEGGKKFFEFYNSPKNPKERMTASRELILTSEFSFLFFLGEDKKDAYVKFKDSDLSVYDCPSKIVNKIKNSLVFTDLK